MVNERVTEDIVRSHFKNDPEHGIITIEEQKSKNPRIDKLLKNASKSGIGVGKPEFIITFKKEYDFIIIIECKADVTKHESETKNKYKDYAVDGVLLYSSFISKEYDVLSIAISGEDIENIKISHFLQLKGENTTNPVFGNKLLSIDNYLDGYTKNEFKFNQEYHTLLKYSNVLNDFLHSKKIIESQRSLLISGILIALDDEAFKVSYKKHKNIKQLTNSLVTTIINQLSNTLNQDKIENLTMAYSFIKTQTSLSQEENVLKDLITDIDQHVNRFMKTYKYFDVLGQFYVEFLRYANNDKGLGIVLTPPHITELFSDLAMVNKNSTVFDNCAGTGGFLISAMKKMINAAKGDNEKIKNIHEKQIVGIEYQDHIFALICSNMYIHGDGKSNIIHGNCFDKKNITEVVENYKPNIGVLNPPYHTDKAELEFVLNNISMLEQNSTCIAIVPMSHVLVQNGAGLDLKEKILENNTLEAVFSMPLELFINSNATVATCIMVIKAHQPHPADYETYFGHWRDDGFIKRKLIGRGDYLNKWSDIKKYWLSNFRNKKEVAGHSVKSCITANDEWCVEAYMDIDFTNISHDNFINTMREYLSVLFSFGKLENVSNQSIDTKRLVLNKQFKRFKLIDDKNENGLFKVKKGERLNKDKRVEGNIPLITATSVYNGVSNFIDKDTFMDIKKLFKNKITIDMFSNVFYHGYEYFSDDNVHTLIFKNDEQSIYVKMYVITLLKQLKIKYTYGRQVRLKRLIEEYIYLPVDSKGKPDWKFMENYIKSLPYSKSIFQSDKTLRSSSIL